MPRQRARQLNMDLSADVSEPTSRRRPARARPTPEPKSIAILKRPPEPAKPPARVRPPKTPKLTEPVKPAAAIKRAGAPQPRNVPKSADSVNSVKAMKTSKPVKAKSALATSPATVKQTVAAVTAPLPQQAKKARKPAGSPGRRVTAGAHRIVDLSQPHNTNTQEGALLFALQILSGAQAIWEHLRQIGPSDAELEEAIESYFPVLLGFHAERQKGFYIGRKPEPFFLWGNTSTAGGCLAGGTLLKKVRAVLCLPNRTQKG